MVVRGRRMSEIESDLRPFVQAFIGAVTAPPLGRGYARWNRRVCIGVHNLQAADAAHYIADRISQQVADVGLEPSEPGCVPEVVIVFTTDATQLATYLVKHNLRLLPGMGRSGMNLSREALDAFAKSDKPVRWWHVSMPVDVRTGGRAIRQAEDDSAPTMSVQGPSRRPAANAGRATERARGADDESGKRARPALRTRCLAASARSRQSK